MSQCKFIFPSSGQQWHMAPKVTSIDFAQTDSLKTALSLSIYHHQKPSVLHPITAASSPVCSRKDSTVCLRPWSVRLFTLRGCFFSCCFFSHVQVRISRCRTNIVHGLNSEQSSEVRKIVVTRSSSQERCVGEEGDFKDIDFVEMLLFIFTKMLRSSAAAPLHILEPAVTPTSLKLCPPLF